jgi:hypothetical protein
MISNVFGHASECQKSFQQRRDDGGQGRKVHLGYVNHVLDPLLKLCSNTRSRPRALCVTCPHRYCYVPVLVQRLELNNWTFCFTCLGFWVGDASLIRDLLLWASDRRRFTVK